MKYGVQLYSLREMAEKVGMEGILKAVSEAGYDGVEFAGFHGCSPKEVKALLDKYNLIGVAAHIGADDIENKLPYIDEIGMSCVFTPGIWGDGFSDEKFPEQVEMHKNALEILNKRGVKFGYHNHDFEFNGGKNLVKKITDAVDGMKVELDLCWATVAGRNVVETMKEFEGKLEFIHIKECPFGDARILPPPVVGEGAVDMKGAFAEAKRQGLEWGILEVEKFDMPEEEYLKKSLENIKKLSK